MCPARLLKFFPVPDNKDKFDKKKGVRLQNFDYAVYFRIRNSEL